MFGVKKTKNQDVENQSDETQDVEREYFPGGYISMGLLRSKSQSKRIRLSFNDNRFVGKRFSFRFCPELSQEGPYQYYVLEPDPNGMKVTETSGYACSNTSILGFPVRNGFRPINTMSYQEGDKIYIMLNPSNIDYKPSDTGNDNKKTSVKQTTEKKPVPTKEEIYKTLKDQLTSEDISVMVAYLGLYPSVTNRQIENWLFKWKTHEIAKFRSQLRGLGIKAYMKKYASQGNLFHKDGWTYDRILAYLNKAGINPDLSPQLKEMNQLRQLHEMDNTFPNYFK